MSYVLYVIYSAGHLSPDKRIRQFCYYQEYFTFWSCLYSRKFQRLPYRPRIGFYYKIFFSGNRVDLEKEQNYNRLKKIAICQQKVADAILFMICFISSKIMICFIFLLSVRKVFTLVTFIFFM